MTKNVFTIACMSLLIGFTSCNDNKKTDEVEVPLPEVEETVQYGNPADVQTEGGPFQMKGLSYNYDALEPYIDGRTMEIHYSKHHLGYANNLNKAILGTPMESMEIEALLAALDPDNKAVRNNAGGYYNHNLFWETIAPNKGGVPQGELAEAINKDFGSFDIFRTKFTEAAMGQFGSGWAWLVVTKEGLSIISTPNQDNPLMKKAGYNGIPVLGIDVWEHAYYLNYQNKRKDYIDAFFNLINWDVVATKWQAASGL